MRPLILVADDNDADVDLLRLAFDETGYDAELLVARDGIDAIAQLSERTPSLAIVDIKMPRSDGFELLQRIRADDRLKAMPVIMMSSSGATGDRQRAAELGASRYWVKPSRFDDLLALVRTLPGMGA
jgi:chemosensory pili system protein ChpA (sensor histidine kinase/response regulator)